MEKELTALTARGETLRKRLQAAIIVLDQAKSARLSLIIGDFSDTDLARADAAVMEHRGTISVLHVALKAIDEQIVSAEGRLDTAGDAIGRQQETVACRRGP